jgi:hypothetical protein
MYKYMLASVSNAASQAKIEIALIWLRMTLISLPPSP